MIFLQPPHDFLTMPKKLYVILKKNENEKFKGCASGEMLLEKILEEDSSFADDSRNNSGNNSYHSDKRHLLNGHSMTSSHQHHHYTGSVHVTNI